MAKLTDKQRLFVAEYITDFNASAAARRAGYAGKTANRIASENLSKPVIQNAIQEAVETRLEALDITAERVLAELARIGFSDMRDYTEWGARGVRLKNASELSEDAARAVAEVSQTVTQGGGSLKFKLHDKKGALELLGKHLKLFTEKHEHAGSGGGPIQMIEVVGVGDESENDEDEGEDT